MFSERNNSIHDFKKNNISVTDVTQIFKTIGKKILFLFLDYT
jgi:hypothetical protein